MLISSLHTLIFAMDCEIYPIDKFKVKFFAQILGKNRTINVQISDWALLGENINNLCGKNMDSNWIIYFRRKNLYDRSQLCFRSNPR